MKTLALFLCLLSLLTACTSGPQPINYGEDGCAHCKMIISDQRFGAEILTKKGRVFKFDAVECLINYENSAEIKTEDIGNRYVTDAAKQATLMPVEEAVFMHSQQLPSPMGAHISAFTQGETFQKALQEFNGKQLNWAEVQMQVANTSVIPGSH